MGEQAMLYRRRKLAEKTGAAHELEFYEPPQRKLRPEPCGCRWACLRRELLGKPEPPAYNFACACSGPIGIVPGYPDDTERMRHFVQEQSLQRVTQLLAPIIQWYRDTCDLYMTTETDLDMNVIRAELVRKLAQLSPDDAESLIAELA